MLPATCGTLGVAALILVSRPSRERDFASLRGGRTHRVTPRVAGPRFEAGCGPASACAVPFALVTWDSVRAASAATSSSILEEVEKLLLRGSRPQGCAPASRCGRLRLQCGDPSRDQDDVRGRLSRISVPSGPDRFDLRARARAPASATAVQCGHPMAFDGAHQPLAKTRSNSAPMIPRAANLLLGPVPARPGMFLRRRVGRGFRVAGTPRPSRSHSSWSRFGPERPESAPQACERRRFRFLQGRAPWTAPGRDAGHHRRGDVRVVRCSFFSCAGGGCFDRGRSGLGTALVAAASGQCDGQGESAACGGNALGTRHRVLLAGGSVDGGRALSSWRLTLLRAGRSGRRLYTRRTQREMCSRGCGGGCVFRLTTPSRRCSARFRRLWPRRLLRSRARKASSPRNPGWLRRIRS